MSIKAACIAVALFGVAVVTAAYICRGYWVAGSEWFLIPAAGAAALYLTGEEEDDV